jgi:hypothetical protein
VYPLWQNYELGRPVMITPHDPENVFGWLDEIQRRPGMYLAETSTPLEELQTLVHGYTAALQVHGVVESVPAMVHFSTWLRHKTTWSTSCGWAHAIAGHTRQDSALATFFTFIAEFRTLVPTTLATVQLSERNQPTGKRAKIGFGGRISRPDQVDVIQYVPEPIHFLQFRHGQRLVDQHTLYSSQGSDSTTLDLAKEWVNDEFSVEPSDWRACRS